MPWYLKNENTITMFKGKDKQGDWQPPCASLFSAESKILKARGVRKVVHEYLEFITVKPWKFKLKHVTIYPFANLSYAKF